MLLKEEKHTKSAVSFKVMDLNTYPSSSAAASPEIKRRLEAYAHHVGSENELSREAIQEKLDRAEENRKQALLNRTDACSPRQAEERRRAAKERKMAIDERNLTKTKRKCERGIMHAAEKRLQTQEDRRHKLRQHIAKVEEIRREQAERRQSSVEQLKQELEKKLDIAAQNRDEKLEHVKTVAHQSSEKKKKSSPDVFAQLASTAYDNMLLPTINKMQTHN